MKPSEFQNRLKEANAAADKGGNFENIEDGLYFIEIEKCNRNVSKGESGRNQISFQGKVTEGPLKDKTHWWHYGLDHDVSLSILLQHLRILEYDTTTLGSMEDFDEICEDISQGRKVVKAQVVTSKKGYQNTKIQEFMGDIDEPTEAPPAPAPEEEAAPEVAEEPAEEPTTATEEEVEEEEGEASVGVGDKVKFLFKKKEMEGEITKLDEESETLSIKSGAKTYKIKSDNVIDLA